MISTKQRIISILSALVFGAVILSSLYFISASSEHDCAGDNCHICEMIRQCEKLLDTLGSAEKQSASHTAALFLLAVVLLCEAAVYGRNTLISLKVELLD